MMPFWCFPEVPDGIFSLFLVCGKQSFPPPGKVPDFSAKTVHFPLVVSSVTCPTRTLLSLTTVIYRETWNGGVGVKCLIKQWVAGGCNQNVIKFA